jgi:apolipoprotein N-acyltransferase
MLRRRISSAASPAPADPTIAAAARGTRPSAALLVTAALAGGASLFSFEPFGWWPLQFLLLAWLFYQVGMKSSVRRATLLGWAFGFGWSVGAMFWLYIMMTRFAHVPAILGAIGIVLLGLYMGLFGAFATGMASWLRQRWSLPVASFVLLVLPVTWGVSEWMRGWVFTGFPWSVSGYAHDTAPLAGYAPLVGVYGIGMLVAVGAGCVVMLTQRARWPAIGLLAALLATGVGLRSVEWTHETGSPITVRLLQGNIPQDRKFDYAFLSSILERYHGMITAAPADLIATPETAIPSFPHNLPAGYLSSLQAFATKSGSTLAVGMPLLDNPTQYANSVVAFSPQPQPYRYDKAHLVPFGEFIPPGFRWVTDLMNIPLNDATRGKGLQAPFAVKDQLVLPNICYEDVFGEEIAWQLRNAPRPATLLLNMSNLSWYGQSTAIPQHLQISRMRTLETGRPMLRSTNDGATAIIDHRGQVSQVLPFYTEGVLSATVRGTAGMTPYIRFGNVTFLVLGGLALAAAWFFGRNYKKKKSNGV